jgi:signal transduction histidine kinase
MEALREQIARDLHDEIGSHLGSIRLMSELAMRSASQRDPSLEEIHRLAGEAAESMRGIVWLVREGNAPRIHSLVGALRQSAGALLKNCEWTLECSGISEAATAPLEFHRNVFLFFREAAHNVARHAGAKSVEAHLSVQERRLLLRLTDDGRGFDPASPSPGNGLPNLRKRANLLRGKLHLQSAPGKGTCVRLEAPVP